MYLLFCPVFTGQGVKKPDNTGRPVNTGQFGNKGFMKRNSNLVVIQKSRGAQRNSGPRRAHNTVMKNWLFIVSYYFFIAADRNVILNTLRRMASLVRFKYVTEHTSLVRFK